MSLALQDSGQRPNHPWNWLGMAAIVTEVVKRSVGLLFLPRSALLAEGQGSIHRDAIEPGGHGTFATECPQVPKDPEEDLLGDVLGVRLAAQQQSDQTMDAGRMLRKDLFD